MILYMATGAVLSKHLLITHNQHALVDSDILVVCDEKVGINLLCSHELFRTQENALYLNVLQLSTQGKLIQLTITLSKGPMRPKMGGSQNSW